MSIDYEAVGKSRVDDVLARLPQALPEPYYEAEGITIYHADCRDVLPLLGRFDLLLTDPPYGLGEDGGLKARYRKGDGRTKGIVKHERANWDAEKPTPQTIKTVTEAARVWMIFGGNYFADQLPASSGWLYWDKRLGGDFSDGELIYTNRDAALRSFSMHAFTGLDAGKARVHPTQKPLPLMQWCLSLVPDAKTVVDPFAGVLTTAVACKLAGIECVAIEREERYCEAGVERLRQGVFNFND